MSELIKIITDSSITINRIASLLEENNIPTLIKDNVASAGLAGFGIAPNSIDLYVNDSDIESAQKIIEAHKAEYLL